MAKIIVKQVENPENKFWIKLHDAEDVIYNSHMRNRSMQCNVASGQSVAVFKEDEKGSSSQIACLMLPDYDLLASKMKAGEDIDLSYCYIDQFASWCMQREKHHHGCHGEHQLSSFFAPCCFWNGKDREDNLFIMEGLQIHNRDLVFSCSIFRDMRIQLENVRLGDGHLKFNGADFVHSKMQMNCISHMGQFHSRGTISFFDFRAKNSKIQLTINEDTSLNIWDSTLMETSISLHSISGSYPSIAITDSVIYQLILKNISVRSLDFNADIHTMKCVSCNFDGTASFQGKILHLELTNSVIAQAMKLDMMGMESCSLEGTVITGKFYLFHFEDNVKLLIDKSNPDSSMQQLLTLEENFRQLGDFICSDLCHLWYNRVKYRSQKNVFRKVLGAILDFSCGFGTRPFRLIYLILFTILLFGTMYFLVPEFDFSKAKSLIHGIYVSGVTFFTIGYGDIVPKNQVTEIIVNIEAFIGVFLMSSFTALLTRKLIR